MNKGQAEKKGWSKKRAVIKKFSHFITAFPNIAYVDHEFSVRLSRQQNRNPPILDWALFKSGRRELIDIGGSAVKLKSEWKVLKGYFRENEL